MAAKTLDKALAQAEQETNPVYFRALVLRLSIAISVSDFALAKKIMTEAQQIPLTDEERMLVSTEIEQLKDFRERLDELAD